LAPSSPHEHGPSCSFAAAAVIGACLGQQLAAQTTPDSPYREWVMTYSSARFEALARRLEGLLDRYGGDHDRLAVLYQQAMELEVRFFDAAARCETP
jgi:thiaminase/transcriptional activator TenA